MHGNELTEKIIGAAIEVHRCIGPGLLESAYEECLCTELQLRNLPFKRQVPLTLEYKGKQLDCAYRIDILVADEIVVELKCVDEILPIHKAQLLTYMKLGGWKIGLIINFNQVRLVDGVVRMVYQFNG